MNVESFDISYAVRRDGSLQVTERIVWRFPPGKHRGIFRAVRTVQDWPGDPTRIGPWSGDSSGSSSGNSSGSGNSGFSSGSW